MLRGSVEERIEFAFNAYDKQQTNQLDSIQILECLVEAIHKDFGNLPAGFVQEMMELVLQKLDMDGDGVISFRDFKTACLRDLSLLESLGPVFPRNGNFEALCGKRLHKENSEKPNTSKVEAGKSGMAEQASHEKQLSLEEKVQSYLNYSPLFNELWKNKEAKSEKWQP